MKYKKTMPLIVMILSMLCMSACGMQNPDSNLADAKARVVVITKSTVSSYWKTTFAGAKAAGAEYNLDIMTQSYATVYALAAEHQLGKWISNGWIKGVVSHDQHSGTGI